LDYLVIFIWISSILISIYLLICLYLYIKQEDFIFYPTTLPVDYPYDEFPNATELWFNAKDGARINALYFNIDQPKGCVLYLHGNTGALDRWGYAAHDFERRGYEVMVPDYRTYGKSTGKRSERRIHADIEMIYRHLLEKWRSDQIIVYGRSLGTGPACEIALRMNPQQLILETPYTSMAAMASLTVPIVPTNGLLKYHFHNRRKIRKIKCPVHIFHGTDDEQIPYRQAVRLAKKRGQEAVLTTIVGGDHNNLSTFKEYQKKLDQLIGKPVVKEI